jgi:hypothetical protein
VAKESVGLESLESLEAFFIRAFVAKENYGASNTKY